jgi:predicted choloylglycine hydrolase
MDVDNFNNNQQQPTTTSTFKFKRSVPILKERYPKVPASNLKRCGRSLTSSLFSSSASSTATSSSHCTYYCLPCSIEALEIELVPTARKLKSTVIEINSKVVYCVALRSGSSTGTHLMFSGS